MVCKDNSCCVTTAIQAHNYSRFLLLYWPITILCMYTHSSSGALFIVDILGTWLKSVMIKGGVFISKGTVFNVLIKGRRLYFMCILGFNYLINMFLSYGLRINIHMHTTVHVCAYEIYSCMYIYMYV